MSSPARICLALALVASTALAFGCSKTEQVPNNQQAPAGAGGGPRAAGGPGQQPGAGANRDQVAMALKTAQVELGKRVTDLKARVSAASADVQKDVGDAVKEIDTKRGEIGKRIVELPKEGWQEASQAIRKDLVELDKSLAELTAKVK